MNENRCANSEALARYEKECDKNERIHEANCESMYAELDDALEDIERIYKSYELMTEARQYIQDKV